MEHKFTHTGASTRSILDAERVLKEIGLKKGDSFLDAGSGSGYMSIAASGIVGDDGKIYAVDIDPPSIDSLKAKIKENKIGNIQAAVADITKKTLLGDGIIDICLMANVMHGFVENNEIPGVMKETNRLLKKGALLAVVEFKKLENIPGPPFDVKLAPEQVISILAPHGYKRKKVVEVGTYHYLVLFTKE